jgi:hypothetical protein
MNKPIFINECFGETLEFAESLGWQENQELSEQEWNCEVADGLEYDALDFIEKKGFKIVYKENSL